MNPIEKASYDDLRQWMVDIPQFVLTHGLHPWVAMHVASNPSLQMVPLCDVSAQLDVQYPNVRALTAKADAHSARPLPASTYQPAPAPAPAPVPTPTRDFLADDYVDGADSDDDFVDQRSHYSRADTATPADFVTIDQAVDTFKEYICVETQALSLQSVDSLADIEPIEMDEWQLKLKVSK